MSILSWFSILDGIIIKMILPIDSEAADLINDSSCVQNICDANEW